jgi:hypothetical protein
MTRQTLLECSGRIQTPTHAGTNGGPKCVAVILTLGYHITVERPP